MIAMSVKRCNTMAEMTGVVNFYSVIKRRVDTAHDLRFRQYDRTKDNRQRVNIGVDKESIQTKIEDLSRF
jgi:hypothetical protein